MDFTEITSVVEFGCADGATLLEIRNKYSWIAVYGFDYQEASIIAAKSRGLDAEVFDINDMHKQASAFVVVKSADVILLLDILEHINMPEYFVEKLREHAKDGALMIVSLPNVRNWRTFAQLFSNDWRYEDTGIFDKTHVRFYAKKSALRLAEHFGKEVIFDYRYSSVRWKAFLQRLAPSLFCGQMYCLVRRGK
ncbi:MAG: hypothetical protein BWK72_10375 [Rhodoferax ferrireducens]|nr:MAG: hypothetical protein BWK72_10375 [Rhodoferax ferrireducens]